VRRILVLALIVGAALLSTAGTSQAATRWPARCSNFKCVNAHLNALHTAQKKTAANLNGFLGCVVLGPITQYANFLSDDGVTSRTGLDATATGDPIDVWLLGIAPGTCGFGTTASKVGKMPFRAPNLMFGGHR
jgi:hypothetical protein